MQTEGFFIALLLPLAQPLEDGDVHQDHQHAIKQIFQRNGPQAYTQVVRVIIPYHFAVNKGTRQNAIDQKERNQDHCKGEIKTTHIPRAQLQQLERQEKPEPHERRAGIQFLEVIHAQHKHGDNQRAGDQLLVRKKMITFYQVSQREIGKHTGIRYTNKEQDLFEW